MPPSDNDMMIGELKGKLDMIISNQVSMKNELKHDINGMGSRFQSSIDSIDSRVTKVDERVNKMDVKSARYAISIGAISAIGFSLLKEKLGF
jgi:hypothetical protein